MKLAVGAIYSRAYSRMTMQSLTICGHMRIAYLINSVRVLVVLAAFACCGCIDISSTSRPSSNTTCTTTDNGSGVPPTTTCTSKPTGGSHWSFLL
jgi:hypothetical protein